MTSPNGNGAALNGALPTASALQPKFDLAAVTTFWMSSSARLMRSSEILMRGMTEVGRLEAELGQQYLQRSMSALQTPVLGTKPDQLARTQMDHAMQNVDGLVTTMRKIADQFRHTIEASTQALFEVSTPAAPAQSLAASIHIDDPIVRRKPVQGAAEPTLAG